MLYPLSDNNGRFGNVDGEYQVGTFGGKPVFTRIVVGSNGNREIEILPITPQNVRSMIESVNRSTAEKNASLPRRNSSPSIHSTIDDITIREGSKTSDATPKERASFQGKMMKLDFQAGVFPIVGIALAAFSAYLALLQLHKSQ